MYSSQSHSGDNKMRLVLQSMENIHLGQRGELQTTTSANASRAITSGPTREYYEKRHADLLAQAEELRVKIDQLPTFGEEEEEGGQATNENSARQCSFTKLWNDSAARRAEVLRDFEHKRLQFQKTNETNVPAIVGARGQIATPTTSFRPISTPTSKCSDKQQEPWKYSCAECDRQLNGASSAFTENSKDIGFYCKTCNDEEDYFHVVCSDCLDTVGEFCAGTCKHIYCWECILCKDGWHGETGEDQYCSRECARANEMAPAITSGRTCDFDKSWADPVAQAAVLRDFDEHLQFQKPNETNVPVIIGARGQTATPTPTPSCHQGFTTISKSGSSKMKPQKYACMECNTQLNGVSSTFKDDSRDIGFYCRTCKEGEEGHFHMVCSDCLDTVGEFCAGTCKRLYCWGCILCKDDWFGEHGEDQYCSRECTRGHQKALAITSGRTCDNSSDKLWADSAVARAAALRDFERKRFQEFQKPKRVNVPAIVGARGQIAIPTTTSFRQSSTTATSKSIIKLKPQKYACMECNTPLRGVSSTFKDDSKDIGFYCKTCKADDEEDHFHIVCSDCVDTVGEFCAGTCKRLYCWGCILCKDGWLGEEGEDQFCSRECCTGIIHTDASARSLNNRPFDRSLDESSESSSIRGEEQLEHLEREILWLADQPGNETRRTALLAQVVDLRAQRKSRKRHSKRSKETNYPVLNDAMVVVRHHAPTAVVATSFRQSSNSICKEKSTTTTKPWSYACAGCDTKLSGASSRFKENYEDARVGFYCETCTDEGYFDVYCLDCVLDSVGQFCAGTTCKRLHCFECKGLDDFFGIEGEDQYCSRECAKSNPCAWDRYKNHRRSYRRLDESSFCEDEEEPEFRDRVGFRQCEGITQRGERCQVTSSHSYASAASLQEGDRFCTHHGGMSRSNW